MVNRRVAIVMFCLASSLVMSSCVKDTLSTVTSSASSAVGLVGTVAKAVFNTFRIRHGNHTPHTHVRNESKVAPTGKTSNDKSE